MISTNDVCLIKNDLKCPYCGSSNLKFNDYGALVCLNCGSVIEDVELCTENERRFFSTDDFLQLQRTTLPEDPTLQNINTDLLRISHKSPKKYLSYETNREKMLRKLRNIVREFSKNLHFPQFTIKTALNILLRYAQKYSIRERELLPFTAAALYIAAKQTGHPCPLERILKTGNLSKKRISRAYKRLRERLGIQIQPVNPEYYIISFGRELGLSGKAIRLAVKILKHAYKRGLAIGKDPAGLAAASLYAASMITGEYRSRKKIAEVAFITEVTIKNRYQELKKHLSDLIIFKKT